MKRLLFLILITANFAVNAQNTLTVNVLDNANRQPIVGAAVQIEGSTLGDASNTEGSVVLQNVPNGKQTVVVSFVGYVTRRVEVTLPTYAPLPILLAAEQAELETAVVTSTRTNSRIEDVATKIEVLGADDVEEENSIKPSNIGSLLGDLSIIHIQQNSAVSGASSVRMQGLDGKYTQILRDGLPLYEGFSGSFGVLQIPPLDLKQIEILKGSNSTLFGGGAIGGLINLISKEPTDSAETSLTLNRSTLKETNLNGYYAKRFGKIGLTMFAGGTLQDAVDVNGDGFSDVPEVQNLTLHPRLFYYFDPQTTLKIGLNSLFENRLGGDMSVINYKPNGVHQFYEKNKSTRQSIDFQFTTDIGKNHLAAKSVVGRFDRAVEQSGFLFQGRQNSAFGEVSDYIKSGKHDVVFGANFVSDGFEKRASDSSAVGNFENQTVGIFLQDGWQITAKWLIETGVRADFLTRNADKLATTTAAFILPRIAILFKALPNLTFRISGGTGYKVPTLFTQEALSGSFKNLRPLSISVESERSTSVNGDINFHTLIADVVGLSINQAFYFTDISKPVVLQNDALVNAVYSVRSLGTDTYIRLKINELQLYLGYNHTNSDGDGKPVLFAPRDKFSSTLAYEIEGAWRLGIENSWVGNQYIADGQKAGNYWFWAAMVERKLGANASIVVNCENIFDERQSRREPLFDGSIAQPIFRNLYMPIDGRVVNVALRVKL